MNDFRSLLEKYKKGHASEDEVVIVEEALEKNKAINDYLAESIEDFSLDEVEDISVDLVHKKVNTKLRKNIIISVLIVMSIFVLAKFVLSPIMDLIYYDPSTITYGQYQKDINYDMAAFTELNVPGYKSYWPIVEKKGFGTYDLVFKRKNLFEGFDDVALGDRIDIKLIRGKRQGYFDYLFGNGIYLRNFGEEFDYSKLFYETPLENLKKMPTTNYASVYLEYNELIGLIDLVKTMDKEKSVEFKWIAIKNKDISEDRPIGFNPSFADSYNVEEGFDKEKYPFFDLNDFFEEMKGSITNEEDYMALEAELYENHFLSLVNYLNDREEFVRLFGYNTLHYDIYQETLDYIDENGMNVHGILLFGEAKDLVSFIENSDIKTIEILDVKASRYSK